MLGFGSVAEVGLAEAPSSALNNYNLAIAAGSYALSGKDVNFAVSMPASTGVYTVSGQPVNFAVAMPAAVGTYVLAGNAVGLRATRRLVISTGTYSLGGVAVNLLHGTRFVVGAGAYAVAGQAVNFKVGMPAATGVYVLSGKDVDVRRGHAPLFAETGQYTLTGGLVGLLRAYLPWKQITDTPPSLALSYSISGNAVAIDIITDTPASVSDPIDDAADLSTITAARSRSLSRLDQFTA